MFCSWHRFSRERFNRIEILQNKYFRKCVSSTRLIIYFDLYLWNFVEFFNVTRCSYNSSFRCICTFIEKTTKFCFRVCIFIKKTNFNYLCYILYNRIVWIHYTCQFKSFVKNLFRKRINETKNKCIQRLLSYFNNFAFIFFFMRCLLHVIYFNHMKNRNYEICYSCAIIRSV